MKYTDEEFKQLPNIIYYTGHWRYGELLSNAEIPYQIMNFQMSITTQPTVSIEQIE